VEGDDGISVGKGGDGHRGQGGGDRVANGARDSGGWSQAAKTLAAAAAAVPKVGRRVTGGFGVTRRHGGERRRRRRRARGGRALTRPPAVWSRADGRHRHAMRRGSEERARELCEWELWARGVVCEWGTATPSRGGRRGSPSPSRRTAAVPSHRRSRRGMQRALLQASARRRSVLQQALGRLQPQRRGVTGERVGEGERARA
jgi:hypothetical protein